VSHSQIAVGKRMVQHNYGPGSTVNNIVSGEARRPRERETPVSQLPRDLPRLHGRGEEVDRGRVAMGCGQPIQFCGPSGIGKTALLRHLSHRPSGHFPHGVVYYRSRHESLDDLLTRIFEFFYESDGATKLKPTSAELERYLVAIEALFLLDDIDLGREDLETLLQTVPRSSFVLGSPARSLLDGESVRLRGLRQGAAVALVQDRLGRRLDAVEITELAQLSNALDGHPLQLVQAAIRLRDEGTTAAQLLAEAGAAAVPSPADRLTAQIAASLPEGERRVLSLLAALDGTPLHVDHVAALTARADAPALLADLEERRLAQSHGLRYFATAPVAALEDAEASHRWRSSLLTYYIDLAERHRSEPERLRDDLEPIIRTLRWGMAFAPHADVLRLARESGVIAELAGLWDAWRSILDIALDAARMIGDRAGEGWAQHELGTRALCLEQDEEAGRRLEQALRIREKLGDQPGVAATWHNLGHLPHLPPPLVPPHDPLWAPGWLTPLCVVGGIAILSAPVIPPLIGKPRPPAARHAARPPAPGSSPVRHRPPARARPPGTSRITGTTGTTGTKGITQTSQTGLDERGQLRVAAREQQESRPPPADGRKPTIPGGNAGSGPPSPVTPPSSGDTPTTPTAGQPTGCSTDLLTAVLNFVRRQVVVLQRVLALDLAAGLAAEVDAVRRLLRELFGLDCARDQIETQVRRLDAAGR
jgi:AAA domain-containing protein